MMDKYREDESLSHIPVFVFPSTVYFNGRDRDSLKQILTIYNPYEFPIKFKVFSNAPSNYTVIDPNGSIKSKNCVDLILRVSELPNDSSTHHEHKFRVQIYHFKEKKLLGKRDILSYIHWGNLPQHLTEGQAQGSTETFQQCPRDQAQSGGGSSAVAIGGGGAASSGGGGGSGSGGPGMRSFLQAQQGQQPNYVVILTAVLCIVGLMLPSSENENCGNNNVSPFIPTYLHLTVNQKLLAAYALGLVTMVIFRP